MATASVQIYGFPPPLSVSSGGGGRNKRNERTSCKTPFVSCQDAEWRLVSKHKTRGCERLASRQSAQNFQHNEFSADAFSTQSIRALPSPRLNYVRKH